MSDSRIVIISNRLPVVIKKEEENIKVERGSGGLVTAMAPVLKDRGGLWIGWSGSADVSADEVNALLKKQKKNAGFALHAIELTPKEIEEFYQGYSNEIIWPLFHDLLSLCVFKPAYWHAAKTVMAKFADAVIAKTQPSDFIWVHDYQLITLGQELRSKGDMRKIAFFLHIPFPPLDIFVKLPWRFAVLRAFLDYDLLGFQTLRDARNFIQCVRFLLPDCHVKPSKGRTHIVSVGDRQVTMSAFPISINYQEFAVDASSYTVEKQSSSFHEKLVDQQVVFSLDRLDFTKGIPYRLLAIKNLLEKYPEIHKKVVFIQVVVPSRTEIPGYKDLKQQIDRLVGEINSLFAQELWQPIHYIYRSLSKEELLMYYRTSEVCLVTSLKDGMNLVCKEFIASNVNGCGVLILSEFAGAISELHKDALAINPYDVEGISQAIYNALTMSQQERKLRMSRMKRIVQKQDIFRWVEYFLNTAFGKDLYDFPLITDYLPQEDNSQEPTI